MGSKTSMIDTKEAMRSGVYISGTTGSGKSDLAMYIADYMIREDIIVVVFDPSQDWRSRSGIPNYKQPNTWEQAVPQTSVIYDLSEMSIPKQKGLVEDFCQRLMRQQATTDPSKRRRYFLVFEEAHTYFPEGCLRARKYEETVRMMTQGRNYDVRFMCITQFASLLDKNAMRYMRQRYFGFTDEPNDLAYVQKFIETSDKLISTLKAGDFIYKYGMIERLLGVTPYPLGTRKPERIIEPQTTAWTPNPNITMPVTRGGGKTAKAFMMCLLLLIAMAIGLSQLPH